MIWDGMASASTARLYGVTVVRNADNDGTHIQCCEHAGKALFIVSGGLGEKSN